MLLASLYGFATCLFLAGLKREFIYFFYVIWSGFNVCLYKSSQLSK